MSRTIIRAKSKNPAQDEQMILNILTSNGYEQKVKNGEVVYQKGTGVLFVPKFIKYTFNGNEVILEGWVRNFGIFGESKLEGFVGAVPKQNCKDLMMTIARTIGFD